MTEEEEEVKRIAEVRNRHARLAAAGNVVAGTVIVTGDRNIAVGRNLVGGDVSAREIRGPIGKNEKTLTQEQAFDRIAAAVKLNLTQIEENIQQARKDSSQFFKLTLVFASLGFVIVMGGVILLYLGEMSAGIVAAVSSSVPEVTAALFFRKDQELRKTIEAYHGHMLSSQKLMTMIDVAETIRNAEEQDKMKRQIILSTLGVTG
jgi:formylmethanofuran dehydrogenase subunit C